MIDKTLVNVVSYPLRDCMEARVTYRLLPGEWYGQGQTSRQAKIAAIENLIDAWKEHVSGRREEGGA